MRFLELFFPVFDWMESQGLINRSWSFADNLPALILLALVISIPFMVLLWTVGAL